MSHSGSDAYSNGKNSGFRSILQREFNPVDILPLYLREYDICYARVLFTPASFLCDRGRIF